MNLYIMRHGTTIWNEKKIIQGRSNNRLSKNGIIATEEVSKEKINTKFDVIYVSPLMRTMQTANIMNKYHNVKIIKDERLIEIEQGIFTGRLKSSLSTEELILKNQKSSDCGMESYDKVYNRVKDFLADIKENCKYQNVLIIAHNIIATFLDYIILNHKVDYTKRENLCNFDNNEIRLRVIAN